MYLLYVLVIVIILGAINVVTLKKFTLQYEIMYRNACCNTGSEHGPKYGSNVLHINQFSIFFSSTNRVLQLRVVFSCDSSSIGSNVGRSVRNH